MPIIVNVTGILKTLTGVYSNVGGTLKTLSTVHANVNGALKQIYSDLPSTITGTASGSGSGSTYAFADNILISSECTVEVTAKIKVGSTGGGPCAFYCTKEGDTGSIVFISASTKNNAGTVFSESKTLSPGTYSFYYTVGGYTSTGSTTSASVEYTVTFSH